MSLNVGSYSSIEKIEMIPDADDHPAYIVDFAQYQQTSEKVNIYAVQYIQYFVVSVFESIIYSIKNLPLSFSYTVFGYRNRWTQIKISMDLFTLSFRIIYWALGVLWGTFENTFNFYADKLHIYDSEMIADFAGEEINPHHLTCKDDSIDMQGVPDNVVVNDLLDIFGNINFSDPNSPGYMKELSRTEGGTVYTTEDLRKSLEEFIKNINGRVPFLGTPPAYDVPKLMSFYQQIEDAVRSSVHKVQKDLKTFKGKNGNVVASYNEQQRKTYSNLLENQARLVIDFAVAGKHCGARYMGEAMDSYYLLHEDVEVEGQTLQAYLRKILAHKRKEVAIGIIQKKLGTDTHSFNRYMAGMGPILGIPGTKNITETLAWPINIQEHLRIFFKEYTVGTIIETVQEKYKSSQQFREKVFDWVQDQMANWRGNENTAQDILTRINQIKETDQSDLLFTQNINLFIGLIQNLKNEEYKFLQKDNWESFVENLLYEQIDGEMFEKELPPFQYDVNSNTLEEMQKATYPQRKKQELISCLKGLDGELRKQFQGWIQNNGDPIQDETIEQRSQELGKVKALQKELSKFGVSKESIERICSGEARAQEIIDGALLRLNQSEFLSLLFPVSDERLMTSEFMEWLLVSQGILYPQLVQEVVEHG